MKIFAFGIRQLTKAARPVNLAHGMDVFVKERGLEHHVLQATGPNCFEQLVRILKRAKNSRHRGGNVFAVR
jgi:hypothetical protein